VNPTVPVDVSTEVISRVAPSEDGKVSPIVRLPIVPSANVLSVRLLSNQRTPTTNVSRVPGSVNEPVRVALPSSLIAATGSSVSIGATLLTSTAVDSSALDSPVESVA
jgi:hypothetical protein